jgi:anti-sigma regulatory factor (Ser/Thr protein kinase)
VSNQGLSGLSARAPVSSSQKVAFRPWEHSSLVGARMNHHHGDLGISRRTPRMTRSMARYLLNDWGVPAELIGVAELVISELATNAIRPDLGRPARVGYVPYITQWFWHTPDLVVIEISDKSRKPPELQVADDDSESGRGLMLVEGLSREWGYYYDRKGWKTVYCVIGARRPGL